MRRGWWVLLLWGAVAQAQDTVCASGCDYTSAVTCMEAQSPGGTCQITDLTHTEFIQLDGITGTAGNLITLQGATGNERLLSPDRTQSFNIVGVGGNSAYLKVENFCAIGNNDWVNLNPLPLPDTDNYGQVYGLRINDGANRIWVDQIGTPDPSDNCALWGGSNYQPNQVGNNGFPDGVSNVRLTNIHQQLQGNNICSECAAGTDWGDGMRVAAPCTVVEDFTFYQGGHNPIQIMYGPVILRRGIIDNDWIPLDTGRNGYRAGAIALDLAPEPGESETYTPRAGGDVLVEQVVFRNNTGGRASGITKNQAYRGVFRFIGYVHGRGRQGIKVDRNNGDDGDVTESAWSHITVADTESFWRTNQPSATECDDPSAGPSPTLCDALHERYSIVNAVLWNLGQGDNLIDNAIIYNRDETALNGAPNGWKNREYRGVTTNADFDSYFVHLNDNTGGGVTTSLTDATTTIYPNVFQNWDEDANLTIASLNTARTSWDFDTVFDALRASGGSSIDDVEPVTTTFGTGGPVQTVVTLNNARHFWEAPAECDLTFLDETNKSNYMWLGSTRVQITDIDKDTGDVTYTPATAFANGDPVYQDLNGAMPTIRGAAQPEAVEVTGPGVPLSRHLD